MKLGRPTIGLFLFSTAVLLIAPMAEAATVEVTVRNFEFDPPFVAIQEGDIVRWVWESGSHTTTSGDPDACTPDGMWDSPITMANPTFEFEFTAAGTYEYYCIPHCISGMSGVVYVDPAGTTVHEVLVSDFVFEPENLTIAQGDIVRWMWVEGSHTTTSGDTDNCDPDGLWSAPISEGDPSFAYQFDDLGTFDYYCIPHCAMGQIGSVTVEEVLAAGDAVPGAGAGLILRAASPNPFTPNTTLSYTLPTEGNVQLSIYDPSGRLVRTLLDGVRSAGEHSAVWDARDAHGAEVAAGVYYARLLAAGAVQHRVLVLVR